MDVSLFASSVRPHLYVDLFKSLRETSVSYEVVFAGNCFLDAIKEAHKTEYLVDCKEDEDPTREEINFSYRFFDTYWSVESDKSRCNKVLNYCRTENIKPAQCYEVARRHCKGELVVWIADDCEFKGDIIGEAYRYWKEQGNEKLVLSLQTREVDAFNGRDEFYDMKDHAFFGRKKDTPLMAPIGMMSRKYLESLGGIDHRFITGQWENDIAMRVWEDGGGVEIFGDKHSYVFIDHKAKHPGKRAFHTWYRKDRDTLEGFWLFDGQIQPQRRQPVVGFEDKNILTESQGPKGEWD